jgi:serine/threonine protein kinase
MLSTREETDEVIVKLGDFGLSTFLEDEQAPSTYAGTKEYLAPVSCPLSVGTVSLRTC